MSNRSMRTRGFRGLAVATAILLLVFVPSRSCGQQPANGAAARVGVIPDTHGAIAEILLHYDPDVSVELEPVYRDLFAALPDDVRVKVLCPTAAAVDDFISSWESVLEERVADVINVGLPISVWARDRCIARQPLDLRSRSATFVPVPPWSYEQQKHNDLLLQDILHEARLAPGVLDSPLHIEGGNVVSNARHVFFGANVFSENGHVSDSRLTTELERLFGRAYLSVGDEYGDVPWCHIDMYLTPISEDTVLVASPRFAHMLLSADDDSFDVPNCWDELGGTACPSDWLQERFDSVAALAQQHGYKVRRVPVITDVAKEWMVTYNNVLLDQRRGERVVYMPVYGVPPLDHVAAAIYRGLGFEVHTVDVSELYERGGALRCVANVTQRRQVLGPPARTVSGGRLRVIDLAEAQAFDGILDRSRHRLASRSQRNAWGQKSWP
ncbi:MAG: agmatine deiminase family protein [Phycisphaerales bacterium]|nr:MAG: agmatine deiminase family protein [Phycisphaerales bacterium]